MSDELKNDGIEGAEDIEASDDFEKGEGKEGKLDSVGVENRKEVDSSSRSLVAEKGDGKLVFPEKGKEGSVNDGDGDEDEDAGDDEDNFGNEGNEGNERRSSFLDSLFCCCCGGGVCCWLFCCSCF